MSESKNFKKVMQDLRREWDCGELSKKEAASNPFQQFEVWLSLAMEKESFEPNAMTLATASADGVPTARTVLLKGFGSEGFEFYTNYNSRKAQDLLGNPHASLVFYWGSLSRQVLIDGIVEKNSRQRSEEYFHSRPRASQMAAFVSEQSQAVESRKELEALIEKFSEVYKDKEIPCPDHWGGFLLNPTRIEFWQGRPDRLHDRLCYSKRMTDSTWALERLAP